MAYESDALRTALEVEGAILNQRRADWALGHAAGIIAVPDSFTRVGLGPDDQPAERDIAGITAAFTGPRGRLSFRTVVFGGADPAEVDEIGTARLRGHNAQEGPFQGLFRFTGRVMRYGYGKQHSNEPTIGGVVITRGAEEAELVARTFVAGMAHQVTGESPDSGLVRFTESMARAAGVEKPSLEQQKLDTYLTLMKGSLRKRGKPVVVERPFVAVV